jgi:1,4-dihydroxy-2-naphthoate octaprenyltransferase
VLLANNIRDVESDRATGKRTLAVRIGFWPARRLFVACLGCAFLAVLPIAAAHGGALLALLAIPLAVRPALLVSTRTDPRSLVTALVDTVRLELVVAVLLAAGLALS